jgi:hypothetical protein
MGRLGALPKLAYRVPGGYGDGPGNADAMGHSGGGGGGGGGGSGGGGGGSGGNDGRYWQWSSPENRKLLHLPPAATRGSASVAAADAEAAGGEAETARGELKNDAGLTRAQVRRETGPQ